MQFKVPQFIDIPDKLFGPFTFVEFVYMVGGAGIVFILYKLLPFWLAIVPMIVVAGFSAMLIFYKINGKPFIYYVQAGIAYAISSKLYIWKQRLVKPDAKKETEDIPIPTSVIPMASSSNLKDLSWSLDVQEKENNEKI